MNISIQLQKAQFEKTNFAWQFGIGNDHAYQILRRDVFEHLKTIHDELGFRYIRFHGIFDDDMLTYQRLTDFPAMGGLPGASKIKELNFRHCGVCYHNVLDAGFKPFVELSFMPQLLAKGKKTGLRYKNNTCMPKSLSAWQSYIKEFILYLTHEFGEKELETWYFEVWNEPDLKGFFNGSQKEYFKLYEATVTAIKEVNPQLKVGGPSTSACKWIQDFVLFVNQNNIPCDFISSHHYPGDAFGNMITFKTALGMIKTSYHHAKNGVDLSTSLQDFFFHPEICKTWKKDGFRRMDEQALIECESKPFFITEYNSMAVFGAPVHDEKYSAAFVIKTCMDLNPNIQGTSFWCGSDLFEEQFMLPKPFVGSFGMISNDGIPKPNFYAFKILSMLYPNRMVKPITDEDVEYNVFSNSEGDVQLLLYAQTYEYTKKDLYTLTIELDDVFDSIEEARIDDEHTNPKKLWEDMGKPSTLNRREIAIIKEQSKLAFYPKDVTTQNGSTKLTLSLYTNDVVFLMLKKNTYTP